MRTLKLTVAYDGTRFVGWQRQAEGESIQGLLEQALSRFEGAPVTVHGAGRTDAGVHALGQVASAEVTCGHDAASIHRGLNASLPPDVRVAAVEDAPAGFHARFSARNKTYRYVLDNAGIASPFDRAFSWHVPERLDAAAMREAASMLIGSHDFAVFQSAGSETSGTVRTITRSEVTTSQHDIVTAYEVSGDGFLRHMVRAIVGTLVEIGRGWRAPGSMAALLDGGNRSHAGPTAPAHGLFLVRVDYD
jgi:tRNA pseudouridine38-40 synthase